MGEGLRGASGRVEPPAKRRRGTLGFVSIRNCAPPYFSVTYGGFCFHLCIDQSERRGLAGELGRGGNLRRWERPGIAKDGAGGNDDVGGGLDPFAGIVEAGVSANRADDAVGGGNDALGLLDEQLE